MHEDIPPPLSLAERIRLIPAGKSERIEATLNSVRSTASRVAGTAGDNRSYITRPEGDAVRIWRLS